MVSMGASLAFLGNKLMSTGLSFDPFALFISLLLLVPLVVLLCCLLLTLALFARTQKEAQSYVSPILFLSIFGVLGAMVPGLELNLTFALIPILNVSLACREMLTGVYNWPLLGLILGTTLVYAAAGLALCVAMFKKESVLFRS
jgi:sodium transport system permease protein